MKHVETCLSAREDRESSFHHCGYAVKLVQACFVQERRDKAVLTTEQELGRSFRPVYLPEKINKAVFTTVDALSGLCKPVYVRERPDNIVLTSEEML